MWCSDPKLAPLVLTRGQLRRLRREVRGAGLGGGAGGLQHGPRAELRAVDGGLQAAQLLGDGSQLRSGEAVRVWAILASIVFLVSLWKLRVSPRATGTVAKKRKTKHGLGFFGQSMLER